MLYSTTGTLASTIGAVNPLRYRGYYYDTETSLYYLQSRYYDPESCRFISADAYIVAGNYLTGSNMFVYCMDNPVVYSDPSGCASNLSTPEGKIVAYLLICCMYANYIAEYAVKNNLSTDGFGDFLNRNKSLYKEGIGQLATLLEGKRTVLGYSALDEKYLIPFKAKAWCEMTDRHQNGEEGLSNHIKKHFRDVYRLSRIVVQTNKVSLNGIVRDDMERFINGILTTENKSDDINYQEMFDRLSNMYM